MTILALEFSSEQRSVALARHPRRDELHESQADCTPTESGTRIARPSEGRIFEAIETGGRNTAAFGMIERVLAAAKLEREEIDAIAIGLGPGSYTGIRSAIAIAQGWQLAQEVKSLGVSSAEAIAVLAQAEKIFGDVNVVIDAQRGEIYLARYEISEMAVKEIEPLRIVSPIEVESSRCDDFGGRPQGPAQRTVPTIFVGPEATKWFPSGKTIFPRAAVIARLAAGRNNFISGESLQPIYLRETTFVKASPPKAMR